MIQKGNPGGHAAVRSRAVAAGSARDGHLHPRRGRAGQAREDHLQQAGGQRRRQEREGDASSSRRSSRASRRRGASTSCPTAACSSPRRPASCASSSKGAARCPSRSPACRRCWTKGQGGLLDVAVHPDYATQRLDLPRRTATRAPTARAMTADRPRQAEGQRLRRAAGRSSRRRPSSTPAAATTSASRFVFDGKGHVFFTIGERGQAGRRAGADAAQRQGAPHQRGRHASRRTTRSSASRRRCRSIWSYGNRNPQGLAHAPVDRRALGSRARAARRRRAEPHPRRAATTAGRSSPTA